MRRALFLSLLSCALCLVFTIGALAQEERPDPTQAAPQPPRQLTPEDEARRAKVIARVGDVRITIGDVEDAVNEQSPFLRARYRDPAQLREFVDGMIRFELLARAAERADVDEDPEVQRVVSQNAVQQLIRRDFDERVTPDSVPDADVQAYYEAHPEEFSRDELRRAAHIQVATREEAERLLPQIRAADARTFRTLARDHSVDPETRLRGGDLRYFDAEGRPRNTRDPRIDETLARTSFGLAEVGDVSDPIQVGERWSIVKLTGQRPAEHRTLEAAGPTIRLRLWRERRQSGLEELVTRLREQAGVEAHYERLRPIRLDPPAREDAEEDEHGAPTQMPPLEAPVQAPDEPEEPEESEE
jgi:peptidyl-prolyl cis-trans isomerase C